MHKCLAALGMGPCWRRARPCRGCMGGGNAGAGGVPIMWSWGDGFRGVARVAVIAGRRQDAGASSGEIARILKLEVPVIVKLAERKLSMSEVMRLGIGAIIEFSKSSDEQLELLINNKAIALGETVKVGENFGLRVTQIGDVKAVVRALGKS